MSKMSLFKAEVKTEIGPLTKTYLVLEETDMKIWKVKKQKQNKEIHQFDSLITLSYSSKDFSPFYIFKCFKYKWHCVHGSVNKINIINTDWN